MNEINARNIADVLQHPVFPQFRPNDYFPIDTGAQLSEFLTQYELSHGSPIAVSFRELVPWVYGGSRASHYLHSYPAKLLPQIAHFFLANEVFCPADGVVLDPFSGSGTVALETILSGRNAHYCDVNPFARLLTKTKTTSLSQNEIDAGIEQARLAYQNVETDTPPDVVNLSYWYNERTATHLSKLQAAVKSVADSRVQRFLSICFSSVVRKLSRANPRFSVPVRLKVDGEPVDIVANAGEVWDCFEKIVLKARRQIGDLSKISALGEATLVSDNVLSLEDNWPIAKTKFGEVDLVITSPPYAGAQKYVRATSLSMGWLDQVKSTELKSIENQTLGREHLPKVETVNLGTTSIKAADRLIRSISTDNQTRAAIVSVFLQEMKLAAENIMNALKDGGYAVVVMADNTVCGRHFPTTDYTSELFQNAGGIKILELEDKIISRSLQTKRASTSSSISHERISVFKKA